MKKPHEGDIIEKKGKKKKNRKVKELSSIVNYRLILKSKKALIICLFGFIKKE